VPEFKTEREAKEFLVKCIVAQAERAGTPLTEVERKMLYFSETGWTLPNILEVNAEFERDYDDGDYEQKIAGLVDDIRNSQQDTAEWDGAIEKLAEGDHYLLYLIDSRFAELQSFVSEAGSRS
jgi:hypothetical protein